MRADPEHLADWDGRAVPWPGGSLRVLLALSIDSTQAAGHRRAGRGEPPGVALLADGQTAGRGRRGAEWISPAGVNLHLTLDVVVPIEARLGFWVMAAAALGLRETLVESAAGLDVWLKWPNDLVCGRRKLAGVMSDWLGPAAGGTRVLVGIGANLNAPPERLPDEATSVLHETGRPVARGPFVGRLLERLGERFGQVGGAGIEELRQAWRRAARFDRWRTVMLAGRPDRHLAVIGLEPDGGLRVAAPGGDEEVLYSDQVSVRFAP